MDELLLVCTWAQDERIKGSRLLNQQITNLICPKGAHETVPSNLGSMGIKLRPHQTHHNQNMEENVSALSLSRSKMKPALQGLQVKYML
jgi:hypothetical protein